MLTDRTVNVVSLDSVTVVRVALAQLNPTVGDLDGNLAKLLAAYDQAEAAGCDLIAFPELAITGYPPEDLVLKPGFVADNEAALGKLAARTRHCAAVVGFVDEDRDLFNAAAVCANGEVLGTYRKRLLPNYAVFDEARYFTPGDETDPLELYVIGGVKVGISICEDVWSPDGPLAVQADGGAELAVNINGSPYHRGKAPARERMLATRAADAHSALVYVNQVGGQDELVFDGCSLVFDAEGNLLARGRPFVEDLLIVDVPVPPVYRQRLLDPRGRRVARRAAADHGEPERRSCTTSRWPTPSSSRSIRSPSCTRRSCSAPRDYCRKNGFSDVVIGLSGGIDSSLVAVIAAEALGRRARPRCLDAVALLERPLEVRRRHPRREPRPRLPDDLDRAGLRRLPRDARAELRRPAAGPDPGEHPEPLPRAAADGAVQRVRLDGADDRQQVGDGRRLLHDLRRLGRRLRGDQGRAEDRGLRPGPVRQPSGPAARSSPRASSPSRRRPSCGPTSATTRACRRTTCSTRSSSCTSRRTAPRRRSSSSATTRRSSGG